MSFLQQIDKFVFYLQVEKNASPNTVTNYQADINSFLMFVQQQGVGEVIFAQITPILIRAYLAHLNRNHYAQRTIARRIASLRSLYKFLCRENITASNPFQFIQTPKIEKQPPQFLDVFEIAEVLSLPADSLLGKRDKALLELLYASGVKVTELVRLSITDVDLYAKWVLVRKNDVKERIIPIGCKAAEAVESYLQHSRELLFNRFQGAAHSYLFVNNQGGPLQDRSVRRIIDKYITEAALNKKVSPSTIRNTFAVHLLNNGADLYSIQEMLGHVNLSTTQSYTYVSRDRIKQIYKNTHPRA